MRLLIIIAAASLLSSCGTWSRAMEAGAWAFNHPDEYYAHQQRIEDSKPHDFNYFLAQEQGKGSKGVVNDEIAAQQQHIEDLQQQAAAQHQQALAQIAELEAHTAAQLALIEQQHQEELAKIDEHEHEQEGEEQ